jgi:hypothetical protein
MGPKRRLDCVCGFVANSRQSMSAHEKAKGCVSKAASASGSAPSSKGMKRKEPEAEEEEEEEEDDFFVHLAFLHSILVKSNTILGSNPRVFISNELNSHLNGVDHPPAHEVVAGFAADKIGGLVNVGLLEHVASIEDEAFKTRIRDIRHTASGSFKMGLQGIEKRKEQMIVDHENEIKVARSIYEEQRMLLDTERQFLEHEETRRKNEVSVQMWELISEEYGKTKTKPVLKVSALSGSSQRVEY